jgi:hypothetical protein
LSRVSRSFPCVVCGKPDWCLTSGRCDLALCCRQESDQFVAPFDGWLHWVPPSERHRPGDLKNNLRSRTVSSSMRDFGDEFEVYRHAFDATARRMSAEALGIDPAAFDMYGIGFDRKNGAIGFSAMQLRPPYVVGVRFRRLTPAPGQPKWWSTPGSTGATLLPLTFEPAETILLSEGPSDCVSAAQAGVRALGRWSCRLDALQAQAVIDYAGLVGARRVLVYGDNDDLVDPGKDVGRRGASDAAMVLRAAAPQLDVVHRQPPAGIKDVRAWVQAGATASDLLDGGKGVAA